MDRHTVADLDRYLAQSDDAAHPEWFAEPPELPLNARGDITSVIPADDIAMHRAAGRQSMRDQLIAYVDELRDVEEGRVELGYYMARNHGGMVSRGSANAHKAAMAMVVTAQKSAMHAGRIEVIDAVLALLNGQETT